MERKQFEKLVAAALDTLPATIQQVLQNVEVVVQEWPTRQQLKVHSASSKFELLGLYEGTPLTQRDTSYNMVLPDKIVIFQGPLEALCDSEESLAEEVRTTVVHELAHHFGIDDERLEKMGN